MKRIQIILLLLMVTTLVVGGGYYAYTYQAAESSVGQIDRIVNNQVATRSRKDTIDSPASAPPLKQNLADLSESVVAPRPYRELVEPDAYLNTNDQPITISEYIGQRVIVLSFMTYSCINCQRTFSHLVALDEAYRDDGLLVIGIHTPEFAFEHDAKRVQAELASYGISFPVVLDNDYQTWRAYENRFWPRRYIINRSGTIVYDHIGEGDYEGTKRVVEALIAELPKS